MTIFDRPSEWIRSSLERPGPSVGQPLPRHFYFAFLSYSHSDEPMARWLHESLEKFRVPRQLVGRLTEHGPIPRRLAPIFRDVRELPAADDLGTEIHSALAGSQYLVVLCSPAAARSKWTNAEIEAFRRERPDGCILAAIIEGEPFASEMPGREQEECLPPALRFKCDRRGRSTGRRAEPLAADLRQPGEARRIGFLKLAAGMLGVGLDELVQRDTMRRHRHMAAIASGSFVGMIAAAALAITAVQARDAARDQRQEAESLVGFMLGDLRAELEPVGRLDALEGVGARVLDYYRKWGTSDLPDESLLQRARALTLMGQLATMRGDLDGAMQFYRQSLEGTSEAIRREPDDPQRLYDHAQTIFWTADVAMKRGDQKQAERAFREYKALAGRMVALEPDSIRWRMEAQNADANLGIVLYTQRRFDEASSLFDQALATITGLVAADPDNREYQISLVDSLAWAADAQLAAGRLDVATRLRERNVALLDQLLRSGAEDIEFRRRSVPAHIALARLHSWRGEQERGIWNLEAAATHAERLLRVEPANRGFLEFFAKARLGSAEALLNSGSLSEAAFSARSGCTAAEGLVRGDGTVSVWRALVRDCLRVRTRLALRLGRKAQAALLAPQAVEAAKAVQGVDPISDSVALAGSYRLAGDVEQWMGKAEAARAEWARAFATLPKGAALRPGEMGERQLILQRVGRSDEAAQVARALSSIGYRHPAGLSG